MQFPESWLREFCNPPLDTAQLAELLTMAGLEVEQLQPAAPPFSGVVVAQILSAEPHPQADRLRVCRVDAGAHSPAGPLQIVCGAPNARAGIRVPLAIVGAQLPPGDDGQAPTIGVGMLRGVESRGMLCSARELGLSNDHAGLLELAADAPVGADLRRLLDLDDTIFTLKLTPNLAHALSVYGVAREVSALTGSALVTPPVPRIALAHDQRVPVSVEAPQLCGRFSGRVVRNVDPKAATPAWMVDRLARCGQRSVTALVDISNYVMFEYDQPTHIFDCDRIRQQLTVRWARPGEALALLNGSTVELAADVGVIADAEAVESLAGIMGGDRTAVSDATRNVYVEAAFWWPASVAGRSRRFAFATDAAHRRPGRAGDRTHPRDLRRRGGPARRPDREPAGARAGADAGRTRRQGHRHGARRSAMRRGLPAARAAVPGRARGVRGRAAELAVRPRDRGGPDRGGRARRRLRPAARLAAARAGGG